MKKTLKELQELANLTSPRTYAINNGSISNIAKEALKVIEDLKTELSEASRKNKMLVDCANIGIFGDETKHLVNNLK